MLHPRAHAGDHQLVQPEAVQAQLLSARVLRQRHTPRACPHPSGHQPLPRPSLFWRQRTAGCGSSWPDARRSAAPHPSCSNVQAASGERRGAAHATLHAPAASGETATSSALFGALQAHRLPRPLTPPAALCCTVPSPPGSMWCGCLHCAAVGTSCHRCATVPGNLLQPGNQLAAAGGRRATDQRATQAMHCPHTCTSGVCGTSSSTVPALTRP
jgi:hypothetical protein